MTDGKRLRTTDTNNNFNSSIFLSSLGIIGAIGISIGRDWLSFPQSFGCHLLRFYTFINDQPLLHRFCSAFREFQVVSIIANRISVSIDLNETIGRSLGDRVRDLLQSDFSIGSKTSFVKGQKSARCNHRS